MIEINGWVSIHASSDGEHQIQTSVISKIDQMIQSVAGFNQNFTILPLNGSYVLFIGINHNHDVDYTNLIYSLLTEICKLAPGSYGIIYIRDHENSLDFNRFKVYKVAKGFVSIEEDGFLSPCNPKIED